MPVKFYRSVAGSRKGVLNKCFYSLKFDKTIQQKGSSCHQITLEKLNQFLVADIKLWEDGNQHFISTEVSLVFAVFVWSLSPVFLRKQSEELEVETETCSACLQKNPPLSGSCLFAAFAELLAFSELCGPTQMPAGWWREAAPPSAALRNHQPG